MTDIDADTDLALADATKADAAAAPLIYACPTEHHTDGLGHWFAPRYIVRLPDGTSLYDAFTSTEPVTGTILYDVDPIESGLDEFHARYEADWCKRKPEPIVLRSEDLLRVVNAADHTRFRALRAEHRVAHGLPRHVVRSDTWDKATKTKAPLYALRRPWPPGIFMQGGKTHSSPVATPEQVADPDEITTFWESDGQHHILAESGRFIEAFPPPSADNPSGGFMRGEGPTFADAEDALWAQWSARTECPAVAKTGSHAWETRGYKNGAGRCADCNVFGSHVFDVAVVGDPCVVCGTRTWWDHVGQIGGEPDRQGRPNRYICSRTVCPDHNPPVEWHVHEILGALGQSGCATADDYRAALASQGLDTTWIDRFLPDGYTVATALAEPIDHRIVSTAVRDGRAWLVDEAIAERTQPLTTARATWSRHDE